MQCVMELKSVAGGKGRDAVCAVQAHHTSIAFLVAVCLCCEDVVACPLHGSVALSCTACVELHCAIVQPCVHAQLLNCWMG